MRKTYHVAHYITTIQYCSSQSRQSAKLFLQSLELGLSQPLTRTRVCPPPHPLVPGGGAHSLAREGVGETQFQRGDIHRGTLYMYVLCAVVQTNII
jgi:hypothetical protein